MEVKEIAEAIYDALVLEPGDLQEGYVQMSRENWIKNAAEIMSGRLEHGQGAQPSLAEKRVMELQQFIAEALKAANEGNLLMVRAKLRVASSPSLAELKIIADALQPAASPEQPQGSGERCPLCGKLKGGDTPEVGKSNPTPVTGAGSEVMGPAYDKESGLSANPNRIADASPNSKRTQCETVSPAGDSAGLADRGEGIITEIKKRAALFVKDNYVRPEESDYLLIESAMMIGASVVTEQGLPTDPAQGQMSAREWLKENRSKFVTRKWIENSDDSYAALDEVGMLEAFARSQGAAAPSLPSDEELARYKIDSQAADIYADHLAESETALEEAERDIEVLMKLYHWCPALEDHPERDKYEPDLNAACDVITRRLNK